jgi:CubicO group peptidase (beta-lactamase class C family)
MRASVAGPIRGGRMSRTRQPALWLVAAVIVGLGADASSWSTPAGRAGTTTASELRAELARFMRTRGFQGVVVVERKGVAVLRRPYGFADLGRRKRTRVDTRYRISWLADQFTDVALLQLAEARKLDLDAPICRYLPPCPRTWRAVTLRMLEEYRVRLALPARLRKEPSLARAVAGLRVLAFSRAKRGDNGGSLLLEQAILEKVAGMSWMRYVRRRILASAKMRSTGHDAAHPRRATPYVRRDAVFVPVRSPNASLTPSRADGIVATADDLARYERALANGTLLSARSYAEMTELVPGSYIKGYYGVWRYGWLIGRQFGHKVMGQSAHGEAGWSTMTIRFPADQLTIILFQNRSRSPSNDEIGLARIALRCPADLSPSAPSGC